MQIKPSHFPSGRRRQQRQPKYHTIKEVPLSALQVEESNISDCVIGCR